MFLHPLLSWHDSGARFEYLETAYDSDRSVIHVLDTVSRESAVFPSSCKYDPRGQFAITNWMDQQMAKESRRLSIEQAREQARAELAAKAKAERRAADLAAARKHGRRAWAGANRYVMRNPFEAGSELYDEWQAGRDEARTERQDHNGPAHEAAVAARLDRRFAYA